MSFSENLATLVADQLERFVTLNRHQLAGHMGNLDFWIAQTRHALEVIDGYQERFRRLKSAQTAYVAEHQTMTTSPVDPDIKGPPDPPRRVPDAALREARRSVTEATYRFLIRCFHDGLIQAKQIRSICEELGIGIDPADLRKENG
jgi:hypothetical protein